MFEWFSLTNAKELRHLQDRAVRARGFAAMPCKLPIDGVGKKYTIMLM